MSAKTILSLLLLTSIISCTSQESEQDKTASDNEVSTPADCSKFKTGKFKFYAKSAGITYLIDRNDSIQTETNLTDGKRTRTHIKWTGDCSYELTFMDETGTPTDTLSGNWKKTLKTTITQTSKDYCLFTSVMEGNEMVLNDTLWVEKTN